ncbi:elongation factor P [Candidatus Parcubacteria bacterium]|jgi:elongation factor P|nr:elongation factor P [Candidatus Parcubacteria bacterium]
MLSFGDLRLGTVISINDEPYQIVFTQHIKVARGGAVVKTKLKNLISGSTLEKTFSGSDNIEEADMARRKANFLYEQDNDFFFMDNEDFEQFQFNRDDLGDMVKYFKEGQQVDVLIFNEKPVSVALPTKITLEVSSAPDGVKGNSAGAATKTVILETGVEIRTPLFIKTGDKVVINTETGDYVERI